jgi:hypothetical protein
MVVTGKSLHQMTVAVATTTVIQTGNTSVDQASLEKKR